MVEEAEVGLTHGVSNPADEIRYDEKNAVLRRLTEVRRQLFPFEHPQGIGELLKRAFKRFAGSSQRKGAKHFDCVEFSTIEDFTKCADMVIQQLLVVNSEHDGRLVSVREVESTRAQLHDKSVYLSFYGQYNSGKSTILNSILHNRFLPMGQSTETSVTVCISPTLEGEEFLDARMRYTGEMEVNLSEDKKKNCLMKNKQFLAHGVKDIHDILKHLNGRARSATSLDTSNCKYHLKAKFPLYLHVPPGWTVYFIDNPGFDDFCPNITEIAMRGLGISSAVLYVTTYQSYRQMQTSGFFQNIYQKNKAIFKQNRLIILINKIDKVCCNAGNLDFGIEDVDLSEEDVISEIHEYIVQVCKCSAEEVPRDVIIPVYGLWACQARMLVKEPKSKKQREIVLKILGKLKTLPSGQGESPEHCYEELPSQELASKLEKLTGILDLEARLQHMAQSSVLVWIQKINHDLQLFLNGSIQKLDEKIQNQRKKREVHSKVIDDQLIVMEEILGVYEKVPAILSDAHLFQTFKENFEEDMKTCDPMAAALEIVQQKIIGFRERIKFKVKQRKDYGPDEFLSDLKELIEDLSAKLKLIVNSRCFSNMVGMCNEKLRIATGEMARLGTKLESLSSSSSGEFDEFLKKKVKDTAPNFNLPDFKNASEIIPPNVCMGLQKRLLHMLQNFISALKDQMPSVNFKQYLQDFYDNKNYFIEGFDDYDGVSTSTVSEGANGSKLSQDLSSEKNSECTEEEVKDSTSSSGKFARVEVETHKEQNSEYEREYVVIEPEHRSDSSSAIQVEQASETTDLASTTEAAHQPAILQIYSVVETSNTDDFDASADTAGCISPSPSTSISGEDGISSGVPSDQETPSKSRRQSGYGKYSELKEAVDEVELLLQSEIQQYFEKFEHIVVKGFCKSYHEATRASLKNFEDTYGRHLDSKTDDIHKELEVLLAESERLQESTFQQNMLTYMRAQFAYMVEKYQKEVF